jgi:predicted hydrocarbon binding protein
MSSTLEKHIALSGFYYPNRMVRIYLEALEDVMGQNGLNAVLKLARLDRLIDNYPPDNLDKHFDFAEFTALNVALEDMFGPRGGRGLALRAGRACFAEALRNFGALAGAGDLAFKVLPLSNKLRIGLPAVASIFNNFSDQISSVKEFDDHYEYTIERCPVCWERNKTDKPTCHVSTGVLQEALRWVSGGHEFRVTETECHAMGDEYCVFVIYKQPLDI